MAEWSTEDFWIRWREYPGISMALLMVSELHPVNDELHVHLEKVGYLQDLLWAVQYKDVSCCSLKPQLLAKELLKERLHRFWFLKASGEHEDS